MRRTAKYKSALDIAPEYPHTTQESLYSHLHELGYLWDSNTQQWEYHDPSESDPPSELIRVRLMTGQDKCGAVAEDIAKLMKSNGYELLEKSNSYPCRPPKGNDDRVYLTLIKRTNSGGTGDV